MSEPDNDNGEVIFLPLQVRDDLRYGRACQHCDRLLTQHDNAYCSFCRTRLARIRNEEGGYARLRRHELT